MKIKRLLNTFTAATVIAGSYSAMIPQAAFAQNATPVSVELFLSVDVSGSVNATEYELQKQGYIAAFQDPEIIDLIESLPDGLAVAIETWNTNIKKSSSWYLIEDANDAANFVEAIEDTLDATRGGGGTDITKAIKSATNKILNNQYDGEALIIDISGDGISKNTNVGNPNSSTYNNYKNQVRDYLDDNGLSNIPNLVDKNSYTYNQYRGEFKNNSYKCSIGQDIDSNLDPIWKVPIEHLYCPPLEEAVNNAENNNITINGLPINGNPNSNSGKKWREGEVSNYYLNHIITSDGFIETASGFDDFTRAVKNKIETEITNVFEQLEYCEVSSNVTNDAGITVTIEDAGIQAPQITGNKYIADFNSSSLGNNGFNLNNAGTTYTYEGNYELVNADIYGGADGSRHIRSVITDNDSSCFRVKVNQNQRYFGFWWSAGDPYNKLTFRNNGQQVGVFVTEDLENFIENSNTVDSSGYYGNPNSNYGNSGEPYSFVNVFLDDNVVFDEVIFETTTNSGAKFESDNHTFSTSSNPRGNRVTNDAPNAGDDNGEVTITQTVTIDLLSNDSDPDLDLNTDSWITEALTITQIAGIDVTAVNGVSNTQVFLYKEGGSIVGSMVENPANSENFIGKASINENQELVFEAGYIPNTNPGYMVQYTLSDEFEETSNGTAIIKVKPFSD